MVKLDLIKRKESFYNASILIKLKEMKWLTSTVNLANPAHGVNAIRVVQALVKKGRTIDELRTKPAVKFKKDELEKINVLKNPAYFPTNQFANQVVQLALSGNKLLIAMFRQTQLNMFGLKGTIHANKPAVINLESLGMFYHVPDKNIEVEAIEYNDGTYIKPEILKKESSTWPLALRWGVTRGKDGLLYCAYGNTNYVPNKEFTK